MLLLSLAAQLGTRYRQHMNRPTSATGPRPVQTWVPDTNAPGFAAEARRQSRAIAARDTTKEAAEERAFWERVSADAWNDLD